MSDYMRNSIQRYNSALEQWNELMKQRQTLLQEKIDLINEKLQQNHTKQHVLELSHHEKNSSSVKSFTKW